MVLQRKNVVHLILIVWCAGAVLWGLQQSGSARSKEIPLVFELYSWENGHGDWNFAMLFTTCRLKTEKDIFNPKNVLHGRAELKRKMLKLPPGTHLLLVDRIPLDTGSKAQGSNRLKRLPQPVIDEMTNFAQQYDLEIVP